MIREVEKRENILKEPIVSQLMGVYNLMVDRINENPSLIKGLLSKYHFGYNDPFILTR